MDNVTFYQQIVKDLLQEIYALDNSSNNDIESEFIFDSENNHFLLVYAEEFSRVDEAL